MTLRPLLDARASGLRRAILQASADEQGPCSGIGSVATGQITEHEPPGEGAR
ncbi:hypothetical protein [Sorangium sp. So ce176]|uniref:hypothetical protein n=1 Tax=Sorangium sp. So ce176 TaxID=3133286 RepID=UPI003F6371C7